MPNVLTIAEAVRKHEHTAVEVAEEALAKAEQLQDEWRAFITLTPELARQQAQQVDQRLAAGERLPLAGVPFAVKDLFDVEGIATTCGSKVFADRVATADAAVVRRLVAAGAVLFGKLNMHECAFGFTGENPHYGDCKNPWNPERIAGGSSSGSAVAVALGICPFTIGSDTGGSIRHPSALCGLVGLKPTYGRVSRAGGVPLSWTMDHVGPLARTASEAAAVLQVIAGRGDSVGGLRGEADESSSSRPVPDYSAELARTSDANRPLAGLRIGLPTNWFFDDLEKDVAAAVDEAIAQLVKLGARKVEVTMPHMEEAVGAHRAIIFSEASSYYQPHLAAAQQPGRPQFSDGIRPLLEAGLFFPAVDYLKAQRTRKIIRTAWSKVFSQVDCLVTPTSPLVATRFGQQTADLPGGAKPLVRAYLDLTLPFNLSGHPAISVPCGLSSDGLPIGMQVVGKPFAEGTILRVAHQYQQVTEWHERKAEG